MPYLHRLLAATGLGKFERKEHFFKLPTIVTLNMKMFSRFNKLAKVNLTLKSSLSLTLRLYFPEL